MRFLYTCGVLVLLTVTYCFFRPDHYLAVSDGIAQAVHRSLYDKRISIRGLRTIRPEAIRALLPHDRSIPWWILNVHTVSALMTQSPYIRTAKLEPCAHWISPWGCFVIDVTERTPAYITTSGNDTFVLGGDGGVIATFPVKELSSRLEDLLDPAAPKPRLLVNMFSPGASSDVVQSRFSYLSQSVEKIESIVHRTISRIELLPNRELLVRFIGYPFEVQFDAPQDGEGKLDEEAQRLKRLFVELHGKETTIRKIDLAYDKIAVVTYIDDVLKKDQKKQQ